ncbi:hypothetical protein GARC_1831 [Paraglaciecola arctica BSs20135]|uniref:Uncharacterized protein n=1 Tax=Paraglaciecola arctica BSs20135 TaxID=493475 RepID=K6XDW1_9ALTE|nr:hypothetical protein GARC_1831 [Paraglaciecola arctica BSs20135]
MCLDSVISWRFTHTNKQALGWMNKDTHINQKTNYSVSLLVKT